MTSKRLRNQKLEHSGHNKDVLEDELLNDSGDDDQ